MTVMIKLNYTEIKKLGDISFVPRQTYSHHGAGMQRKF